MRLLADIAIKTTLIAIGVFCLSAIGLAVTGNLPPATGLTIDGKVVRVIDGDTIVVETRMQYHVRILDCWAPESRTSNVEEKQRGLRSKNRMIQLADGKQVRVHVPLTGDLTTATTMGRVLGRVWMDDGRELAEIMVSEGLATASKEPKE